MNLFAKDRNLCEMHATRCHDVGTIGTCFNSRPVALP